MRGKARAARLVVLLALATALLLGSALPAYASGSWTNYYTTPRPTYCKFTGYYTTYISSNMAYCYISRVTGAFKRTTRDYYVSSVQLGCTVVGNTANASYYPANWTKYSTPIAVSKPSVGYWSPTYGWTPPRLNLLQSYYTTFAIRSYITVGDAALNKPIATYYFAPAGIQPFFNDTFPG